MLRKCYKSFENYLKNVKNMLECKTRTERDLEGNSYES